MYESIKALYRKSLHRYGELDINKKEIGVIVTQLRDIHSALLASMDGNQKELLGKYDEYLNRFSDLINEDCYIRGFRLGAKITLDSFS